jgi:uncharacterized protein (DUF1684 family)
MTKLMDNAEVHSVAGADRPARERWMAVRVLGLVLVIGACAGGCSSGPAPPVERRSYEEQIQAGRVKKDQDFRAPDNEYSPIPAADRATFPGLAFFPIDAAYHVPTSLRQERSGAPMVILLPTSMNKPRRMERVGTLNFNLKGSVYTLGAFAGEDEGLTRLFVPFGDLTNGSSTYRGGRYIELERTATGLYDLDFNGAYHPFCVFNPNYDCPIPPAENRLLVAIEAGERLRK